LLHPVDDAERKTVQTHAERVAKDCADQRPDSNGLSSHHLHPSKLNAALKGAIKRDSRAQLGLQGCNGVDVRGILPGITAT
jgi:hypothetical protein